MTGVVCCPCSRGLRFVSVLRLIVPGRRADCTVCLVERSAAAAARGTAGDRQWDIRYRVHVRRSLRLVREVNYGQR